MSSIDNALATRLSISSSDVVSTLVNTFHSVFKLVDKVVYRVRNSTIIAYTKLVLDL